MSYPVFKEIVGQKNATFPEVGTIQNTNLDLGEDGVVGLKTGNLAHIGNMAIAAYRNVDHKRVLVIGMVLGQYGQNDGASLHAALEAGKSLITSAGGE
ncbi:hypothetical protein [Alicyclobacillus fodiniaquatilis]|uniref:Uncharacterized protein n=1 Tax=Alicyclobacillus fodiniaquatilis TaxID=1661150 RepID=A0ABW4JQ55_9BACL